MKRQLVVLAIIALLLSGCAGWQVGEDVNTQAIAYASGKGVGLLVNQYAKRADAPLSTAWKNMILANAGADPIPAEKIVSFYQEAVMLLSAESKDPYGLISDLTMLLAIYGGSIGVDGKLVLAKPIPLRVAKAFELGYKSGKSAAEQFTVRRAVP